MSGWKSYSAIIKLHYCITIKINAMIKYPIAMRCNQEQFDAIFPKLVGKVKEIKIFSIDEDEKVYLINNLYNQPGRIDLVTRGSTSQFDRTLYERWNEEIFLDACNIPSIGIAVEQPTHKEVLLETPKSDVVLIDDLKNTDNICIVFKGGTKSPVIHNESNGFVSIFDNLANNLTINKDSVSPNIQDLIRTYCTIEALDKILLFPDKKKLIQIFGRRLNIMKGTFTRMDELREVGYYRVFEIAEMLRQDPRLTAKIITLLGLVPFEDYFYDEYQIQLIRNYY